MNRIEIVGLFTAIERMCEKNDLEGIKILTKRVLNEAITSENSEPKSKPKPRKLPLKNKKGEQI